MFCTESTTLLYFLPPNWIFFQADDEDSPPPRLRWRTSFRPALRQQQSLQVDSTVTPNPTKVTSSADMTRTHVALFTKHSADSDNTTTTTTADKRDLVGHREGCVNGTNGNKNMKQQAAVFLRRNQTVRRSGRPGRTQNVALRMSCMHVVAFVACWTPYLVISLWHIFDDKSVEKVSPFVQDALFLTAVLNSCINPFVYGGFYIRKFTRRGASLRRQYSQKFSSVRANMKSKGSNENCL